MVQNVNNPFGPILSLKVRPLKGCFGSQASWTVGPKYKRTLLSNPMHSKAFGQISFTSLSPSLHGDLKEAHSRASVAARGRRKQTPAAAAFKPCASLPLPALFKPPLSAYPCFFSLLLLRNPASQIRFPLFSVASGLRLAARHRRRLRTVSVIRVCG